MDNGFIVSTDTLHYGVNTISRLNLSTVENICDLKTTLKLFVVAPVQNIINDVLCGETSYKGNGFYISEAETRTYRRTLFGEGALGADSLVVLNLIVPDLQPVYINRTVCDVEGYNFNGETLYLSGNYVDTIPSVFGCDSIIHLNLTVLPTQDTIYATICYGNSYMFEGIPRTATGIYKGAILHKNILGCDSTVFLDLTVRDEIKTDIRASICQGDTYTDNGFRESVQGSYKRVLKSVNHCDSTVTLYLTVNPVYESNDIISVSEVQLPYYYNRWYTIPFGTSLGTFVKDVSAVSINGCDSIIHLTVNLYSGFDNLYSRSINLYPNPVKVGSEVTVDCEIPESDRQDLLVEVFNVIGEKVYSVRPVVYPVKIKSFDASGIYVVRIRGSKLHYEGKVVVKD
jgi:hypothetical protein